jgi:hypothetical protein
MQWEKEPKRDDDTHSDDEKVWEVMAKGVQGA